MSTVAPAKIGELQYIKTVLANTHVFGLVTDGDTPDGFTATFEISGDNGVLVVPALRGDKGESGAHAFALRLMLSAIDDPLNLPQTLGNTAADIGKYWMIDDVDDDGNVIGSSAYIWFGDHYRRMMMGTQGPAGPVPRITPNFHIIEPDDPNQSSRVIAGGDIATPSWDFYLQPDDVRGPQGESSTLASCPDVDLSTPAAHGQVLGFLGNYTGGGLQIWEPITIGDIIGKPYTVPQAAFSNYQGVSTRATIGSFQVPDQIFPWKPLVWGHINAAGLELDADPLTIGCEVRLGDPVTGQLVARGFGNSIGHVTLTPHSSTPSTPTNAMTPDNDYGLVIANQSDPTERTLYVNLYNDGLAGVYLFNKANAQLFVMAQPV